MEDKELLFDKLIERAVNAMSVYQEEIKDLIATLERDARVKGLSTRDTVIEKFLDLYSLSVIRHERIDWAVMVLFALVGELWDEGEADVLTRPSGD